MNKYFIYARKSSEAEDRQVTSVDSQVSELETTVVNKNNLEIIKPYLTESQSAKAPGRPEFNKMMDRINNGEVQGIVCWKLNRLARNPVDGGAIIWAVTNLGIEIITPSKTYTKDDLLLMYIEFGMANQFINDLSKDTRRGLKTKAENGMFPSSWTKPGYMWDKFSERGNKQLINDPIRFPLIKKAWELMLTGSYTVGQILHELNKEWGYRTATRKTIGGKPMARSQIYRIFVDPYYFGEYQYPEGSGNWYKGVHEPMVTREEFERVQVLLGRKGKPKPKTHEFPFTGLMTCGECGAMITAEEKWQIICPNCKLKFASQNKDICTKCKTFIEEMVNPTVLHYFYYHCTKRKNPNCRQGSIKAKDLEIQIDELLSKIQISERFKNWAIKYLNEVNDKEVDDRNAVLGSLQEAYKGIVQRIDNLVKLKISPQNSDNSLLSDHEFKSQKEALMKEKASLEEKLNYTGDRISKWVELSEKTFNFACYAQYWFANGDLQTKRQIFSALGSNLILEDKIVRVDLEKPLKFIEEARNEVPEISPMFEPKERADTTAQLETLWSQNPSMLPQSSVIRTEQYLREYWFGAQPLPPYYELIPELPTFVAA